MTVATFTQPDSTAQTGTTYKGAIDGAISVLKRMAKAFAPHEQTSPNMTVRIDSGVVFLGVTLTEVAAQSTGTITAPVTNPRIDRVVVDQVTGVVSVITGTPAGSPTAPAITAGKLPICQVLLQTTSTVITNSMITDERQTQYFQVSSFILGLLDDVDAATARATIGAVGLTGNETVAGNKTLSGTTALQALLDISNSGAGQIKFPATQNASSDVNTLDDYEEGTWTPTAGTSTYNSQVGTYTKIGRLVFVTCNLSINTASGSSTLISGFPFTPNANDAVMPVDATGTATAVVSLHADINGSGATLRSRTAAQVSDVSSNAITANSAGISFSGCYFTTT